MSWDWASTTSTWTPTGNATAYILKEGETDVPESVQKAW